MKDIICKAFEKTYEVPGDEWPCIMCYCGGNDGEEIEEKDCYSCTWAGCKHEECKVTGCLNLYEDKCLRIEGKEKPCKEVKSKNCSHRFNMASKRYKEYL